ncbi:MAG: ABC transporter ATP-binding protein [Deltaproteobacteria bacterium]|nr:ABC transporter ATP-binding protein [Deltaproteobacteria bacterium]
MQKAEARPLIFLLNKFARKYWQASILLVVLSVVVGFVLTIQPLVLAPALDIMVVSKAQPASSFSDLTLSNLGPTMLMVAHIEHASMFNIIAVVLVAYVVISIIAAILSFLSYLLAMWIRTRIASDMYMALQSHILSLPLSFFQKHKTGDLVSRFTQDVTGTAYSIDSATRGILQSAIQIVVSVIVLVWTDVFLAMATIVISSGHMLITRLLGDRIKTRMTEQNESIGMVGSTLQEMLLTIRVVKSFAAEKFEKRRFGLDVKNVRHKTMRYVFSKHIEEPLRLMTDAVAIAVLIIMAFYALSQGRLTVSGFALFLVMGRQVIAPISLMATHILAISGMLGSAARVIEIFEVKNVLPDGDKEAEALKDRISISDVSFAYEKDRAVLENITLEIKRGELVAVVGPSGGGKSTLVDIILRLYDPLSGQVTWDGQDLRQFTQESYRKNFGVVPQEALLLNASVRDNITYGRDANEARLAKAIEIANAYDFIKACPQGLDTLVGDRGIRLSGGQRQRIAIARAIYDQPSVLIMDEATSALDSESERAVQMAIDRVIHQMTAIVIAHRLSTILNADKIVVIKDGRIESMGPHGELLKNSVTYKHLFELQFQEERQKTSPLGSERKQELCLMVK